MCYICQMEIGVRELKQNASEVVRRAEGGEDVTVLVAGRPTVEMTRIRSRRWRSWGEFADLFNGPADRGWDRDRDLVDQEIRDPWAVA